MILFLYNFTYPQYATLLHNFINKKTSLHNIDGRSLFEIYLLYFKILNNLQKESKNRTINGAAHTYF